LHAGVRAFPNPLSEFLSIDNWGDFLTYTRRNSTLAMAMKKINKWSKTL